MFFSLVKIQTQKFEIYITKETKVEKSGLIVDAFAFTRPLL